MMRLQESCDPQVVQIFNAIKGKKVDQSKLVSVPGIDVAVSDGWYKVTVAGNVYVAVYIDKSDPEYNYIITVVNISDIILVCQNIGVEKKYKSGAPAPDNVIPQSTVDKAVSSFPAETVCGTGLWDGCTFNFPNRYLITAGALVGAYYFMIRK